MKASVIAIIILSCIIVLALATGCTIIAIQHSKIIKLSSKIQNSNIQKQKIIEYEKEIEYLNNTYQELISELNNATSLKDYIELRKRINEELQR